MGIAHRVKDCPRDEKEWQRTSDRLNCISDVRSRKNRYHCLPADNLTTLLEFCYNRTRIDVVKGTPQNRANYLIHSDFFTLCYYLYISLLFV